MASINALSQPQLVENTGYISNSTVYPQLLYEFEIKNIPSNAASIKWSVAGFSEIFVNKISQSTSFTDNDMLDGSVIEVEFDEECDLNNLFVDALILDTNDIILFERSIDGLSNKSLDNIVMTGKSNVDQCCREPVTYTATNVCDANTYIWSYPQGWAVIGSQTSQSITLEPDYSSGGTVEVTASIDSFPGSQAYEKTVSKTINRPSPQVNITTPGNLPLCQGDLAKFSFELPCGVEYPSGVEFSEPPAGWEKLPVSYVNNIVTGTYIVGTDPTNITIDLNFDSCDFNFTPQTTPLTLTSAPPTAVPEFYHHQNYHWFHCEKWQFCPGRMGRLTLDYINDPNNSVREVEFELTGNYEFANNNQQSLTKVIVDQNNVSTFSFVGYIEKVDINATNANPGIGGIRARFTNCKGAGVWSDWTTIYQEQDSEWCNTHYPYPDWCVCCEPESGGPQYKKEILNDGSSSAEFYFFPNPANETMTFHNPTSSQVEVQIVEIATTKIVLNTTLLPGDSNISIQDLSSGTYQIKFIDVSEETLQELKFTKL